jgi:hypothetical protein
MTKKSKAIRQELNKNKLYDYLVIHNMTVGNLGKMYGVSGMVIYRIIEENNFNLQLERQMYKNNNNNRDNDSNKIIRHNYYGSQALRLA